MRPCSYMRSSLCPAGDDPVTPRLSRPAASRVVRGGTAELAIRALAIDHSRQKGTTLPFAILCLALFFSPGRTTTIPSSLFSTRALSPQLSLSLSLFVCPRITHYLHRARSSWPDGRCRLRVASSLTLLILAPRAPARAVAHCPLFFTPNAAFAARPCRAPWRESGASRSVARAPGGPCLVAVEVLVFFAGVRRLGRDFPGERKTRGEGCRV